MTALSTAANSTETNDDIREHTSAARARVELIIIGLGVLGVSLAMSLLVPVIGTLPATLNASASSVEWLLTSFLLVGAVSVPIMGRLGDMVGKRKMLLVALAALTIGSLVDSLTSNIGILILGRAIQGIAFAAIPLGISLLASSLPKERVPAAISVVSAMLGVGGSLALPVAGFLADHVNFHVLFWITLVAGAVSFVLTLLFVPESPVKAGGSFDFPGAVLLAAMLTLLLLPLSEASSWGWGSVRTIGCLAASVVLLIVFVLVERAKKDAIVDIASTKRRPIMLTNLSSVLFGFALFASFIGTAAYVSAPSSTGYGFGSSTVVAGLCLLPSGLLMLMLSPFAPRIIARLGAPRTLALGAVIVALGWVVRLLITDQLWAVIVATSIIGIGIGIGYAAMPSLINAHTLPTEIASANGLNSLARSLGGSLASGMGGTLLVSSTMLVAGTKYPTESAYVWLFAISAVAAVAAAFAALFIPEAVDAESALAELAAA